VTKWLAGGFRAYDQAGTKCEQFIHHSLKGGLPEFLGRGPNIKPEIGYGSSEHVNGLTLHLAGEESRSPGKSDPVTASFKGNVVDDKSRAIATDN
jgi:hypothetical protein